MNDSKYFELAASFLSGRNIGYVLPGRLGRKEGDRVEVIFPVPETLDPNVAVIDPSDVRVWVSLSRNAVELIQQM